MKMSLDLMENLIRKKGKLYVLRLQWFSTHLTLLCFFAFSLLGWGLFTFWASVNTTDQTVFLKSSDLFLKLTLINIRKRKGNIELFKSRNSTSRYFSSPEIPTPISSPSKQNSFLYFPNSYSGYIKPISVTHSHPKEVSSLQKSDLFLGLLSKVNHYLSPANQLFC